MKFNTMTDYAFAGWLRDFNEEATPRTSMTILGKPGIGKSACAAAIAQRMAYHTGRPVVNITEEPNFNGDINAVTLFYAADLSSFLPEDLNGLPKASNLPVCGTDMMVATYAVQRWLAPFCVPGAIGVLCLDDLPAAAPAVQVAVRQLVLDRRIGQNKLAKGILLFVTGNRREDKSGASTLPAHFRNATCLLEIDTDVETWCNWYGAQEGAAPVIAAFLRFRPSHHAKTPKEADNRGAFATPRSWAKLGHEYQIAEKAGVLFEVASGLVGEGTATEFIAFINVRNQLVDPRSVLLDPVKSLPDVKATLNTPDKAYAMTTGLGEVAASWRKGNDAKAKKDAPLLFMRAVGHVTQRDREYIATAVNTFISNGGDVACLVAAAKANKDDVLVKGVIDFLVATFSKAPRS